MSKLHLHHLQNSRSFRILWLLEELELEYQLTQYERTKSYLAPVSLEKVHPNGKAPILEISNIDTNERNDEVHDKILSDETQDTSTTALIESGHIIDYLMAKYDSEFKLHPSTNADSQAWRDYDFWMHYSEASAMPPLVMRLVFNKIVERSPSLVRPVAKSMRKQVEAALITKAVNQTLDMVESHLGDNRYFAGGDFSAADIQMAFVIEAVKTRNTVNDIQHNNTFNWLKRCQARPAYKAAVQKGGALEF